MTTESIARRRGISPEKVTEELMTEEFVDKANKLRLSKGLPKKSLAEIAGKGNKEYIDLMKDFVQRVIPTGETFADQPLALQQSIIKALGFGDTVKVKDSKGNKRKITFNDRPFTHEEYGTISGDYAGLIERALGADALVGKGKELPLKSKVFSPSDWK